MDSKNRTTTIENENGSFTFSDLGNNNQSTQERLNTLLSVNADYARKEEIFRSEQEEFEAQMMSNPLTMEKAFSYFGLLLGTFPPAAFFSKFLVEGNFRSEEIWLFGLFLIVNLVSAITGFFTGKIVGKITLELEKLSWHWMILALPFIGLLWGFMSGGAGGLFIFIFGAIFGAMIGGAVGSVALPLFTIFHRLFKKGDKIETKHFLPIAFGITFIISAFIFGM